MAQIRRFIVHGMSSTACKAILFYTPDTHPPPLTIPTFSLHEHCNMIIFTNLLWTQFSHKLVCPLIFCEIFPEIIFSRSQKVCYRLQNRRANFQGLTYVRAAYWGTVDLKQVEIAPFPLANIQLTRVWKNIQHVQMYVPDLLLEFCWSLSRRI